MQYYNHKDNFINVYTYRSQLSSLLAYNMECIIGEAIQNFNASENPTSTIINIFSSVSSKEKRTAS